MEIKLNLVIDPEHKEDFKKAKRTGAVVQYIRETLQGSLYTISGSERLVFLFLVDIGQEQVDVLYIENVATSNVCDTK